MTNASPSLTSSDVIAICSLVVAFLAFVTTIWQGAISRRHNRLSVRPVLDFDREFGKERISVTLKNHGLGVAIINSIHITNNGKEFYFGGKAIENIARMYPINFPYFEYADVEPRSSLAAGDEVLLLMIKIDNVDGENREKIKNMLSESRIHVKYESIYGEKSGSTCIIHLSAS